MQILIYISIGVVIGYFGFKAVRGENKDKNSFLHSQECENVTTQVQEKQNPNSSEMDGQSREEKKNDINKTILELFENSDSNPSDGQRKITNNMVEISLNVADSTATKYLQRLEEDGKIKQVGSTGSGVYYIKN